MVVGWTGTVNLGILPAGNYQVSANLVCPFDQVAVPLAQGSLVISADIPLLSPAAQLAMLIALVFAGCYRLR